MSRIPLTLACWDYDRVSALQHGMVAVEGVDLTVLPLRPEETFFRQLKNAEFDACELSLSSYVLTLDEPDPRFVAIPVFPSRCFRHQSIFINTASGIETPADLIGKRVGTPEFQMTAGVWERGILEDDFQVPVESVTYLTGSLLAGHAPRREKIPLRLPPEISVTPIPDGANLSDMLAAGEIDALYTAGAPDSFGTVPTVRRLFDDFVPVEQEYARRTGIFPIMHVVALRRDVVERHPWIARSLMKAFDAALRLARAELFEQGASKVMLPWLQDHARMTADVLGPDWWSHGLERNRHVLETFLRYSHRQGLARELRTPDELFVAGSAESYSV